MLAAQRAGLWEILGSWARLKCTSDSVRISSSSVKANSCEFRSVGIIGESAQLDAESKQMVEETLDVLAMAQRLYLPHALEEA